MNNIGAYIKANRAAILILTMLSVLYFALATYRLGSLVPNLGPQELRQAAPYGLHGLLNNPLFAPYEILRSGIDKLFPIHGVFLTRLPAVIIGWLAVLSLVQLLRQWYSDRIAFLTVLAFTCSAWTLHTVRHASPSVTYLVATPLLLLTMYGLRRRTNRWLLLGAVLVWSVLLYLPGMVWLVALALVWQRRRLAQYWQAFTSWRFRLATFMLPVMILPLLIWKLTTNLSLFNTWLGLPNGWAGPYEFAKKLAAAPYHLLGPGPWQPEIWLGKLPLLDVALLATFSLGVIFYIKNGRADRSRLLFSVLIIAMLLSGLAGPVSLSLPYPLLFAFIGAGLTYLLKEWYGIFPRNPLARNAAVWLLGILVAVSCLYNLRSYFIAWPHNRDTQVTYSLRR